MTCKFSHRQFDNIPQPVEMCEEHHASRAPGAPDYCIVGFAESVLARLTEAESQIELLKKEVTK